VHHVATPGAARRQLTFSPERVLDVLTRPEHGQFLFAMDEGGAENYQLFLEDRTGGEPRRITDGKSRNTSPSWSPSDELLAWSSNARNGRDMDLYLASPLDPHFQRRLKEVSGQWSITDWSPDESKVVALEYLSNVESYVYVIEDRIKAGIDIVGISNFVSFLKNTQSYRRDLRRAEYGDERDPKMREFLEHVSPLSSVSKIRTPILIVQGQNDPRVPLSESQQMLAAVRKNGVPVWYVVGKNEGHGFAKKANQDYLQAVEVLFLRRFLLGEGG
jgi:dipeptidyl aminopeptidase/acylaminoacyl peptidase